MAVLWLSVLLCSVVFVTADHTAAHDMAQSNIAFARKVYNALAKGTTCDDMNGIVFSPLALQAGLSATYLGAGGATAQELISGLSLNTKHLERMAQGFHEAIPIITKEPRLQYANGLFTNNDVELLPEFEKSTRRMFSIDMTKENFREDPVKALNSINEWANQKTGGKVKQLNEGSVDSSTRLLLASGVHYDGVWRDPAGSPITTPKNKTHNLIYTGRLLFGVFKDLGAYIVQVPYQLTPESSKTKGLKLILIVPIDAEDALIKLHNNLDKINFETIEEELFAQEGSLLVTNLDMEQSHSMKEIFEKVGIVSLFDDTADLKGVTGGNAKMNDILHTASIKMQDERDASKEDDLKGNVIMALGSYIFLVQDPTTKAIVLMGRRACFD